MGSGAPPVPIASFLCRNGPPWGNGFWMVFGCLWLGEKNLRWLGYIGDYTNYMGIIISHYKDPYETTSIMESKTFFFVAHLEDHPRTCKWLITMVIVLVP